MAQQGSKRQHARNEPENLAKIPTGIAGLDDILEGGFPDGRTTLISGGPGTGKTMLGLEFLYKSALAGHAGILLLFEERADAIRRNVRSLGWDLGAMEKAGKLFILEARLPRDAVLSGDFNITPLLAIIEGKAGEIGADRIMIDAIDVLMRIYNDTRREQNELYGLHDWLVDHGFTTVLMTHQLAGNLEQVDFSGVGFSSLIDTIILLRFTEIYNKITRSLLILKSRGTKHSNSYHRFVIMDHGVEMATIPSGARLSELQGQPSTGRSPAEAAVGKGDEQ